MARFQRRGADQLDARLETIYSAAPETSPLSDKRQLRRFITDYYRNIASEDVDEHVASVHAAAALAHLKLGRQRKPGEYCLRVYNPESALHGWDSDRTVVELVHENMPFLVDSLGMTLDRLGYSIQLTVHPLLRIERTPKGRLRKMLKRQDKAGATESFIRMEIRREIRPEKLDAIVAAIESTLSDLRLAVDDWQPMRQKMQRSIQTLAAMQAAGDDSVAESIALLEWLLVERFTFLGFREYRLDPAADKPTLKAVPRTALGVSRRKRSRQKANVLSPAMNRHRRSKDVLLITKANARSTVHRAGHLDYVGIKTFDDSGKATGEMRFVGLLTSQAYSEQPTNIPLIRTKIDAILERAEVDRSGHRGKALIHILNNYPRDELFQASVSDLYRTSTGILNLQDRRRVRLFIRRDMFDRFFSCLVFVPREKYNTEVRTRTEAILRQALNGDAIESAVKLSDSALAQVHFIVYTNEKMRRKISIHQLESDIESSVITWRDRFRDALVDFAGESYGIELFERFAHTFPLAYEEDKSPQTACEDVAQLTARLGESHDLPAKGDYQLVADNGDKGAVLFRVFRDGAPIALSDTLPLLENLGVRVLSERPYHLRGLPQDLWIQDFELDVPNSDFRAQLLTAHSEFASTFAAQLSQDTERDGYNKLVVTAGLSQRDVILVRAYAKYLLQLGLPFSPSYLESILCDHAAALTTAVEWFALRHDPSRKPNRRQRRASTTRMRAAIRDATSLDADRALRALFSVMHATMRSNFYQSSTDDLRENALAFKIDTQNVAEAPRPRPRHEIFVYSPRVEGVHLRAGDIARGGLRWSDRRDDYRTEVLGLMKAQTVKNTVIVPTGAKGGFYPKTLPISGARDALQAEVTHCYRMFIRALLSVTDNIVEGDIVAPDDVVRLDPDDPYLVVAADKGTATFSDTANAIAVERGFWLGDAFASGGSAGYDHKKMAITARGAWEAVKRHFREIGVDTQSDPFTVAGVGDMSGDVFGNGMLLSPTIRLQAAFNHLHIFLDPNPDAATSFAERQRLFELPRSGWSDYNTDLISSGGGVFSRSAKVIDLSPEAQAMLGVDRAQLSPPELIRAILMMEVDLLWNGGIGTYVKASHESNTDVGDRHNDAVRVDAPELRCKVIGEGGNLGFTQLARIEFSAAGGRCNTDFIDNSAGVDSSDREVNIKILLRIVALKHRQKLATRNRLLARMTEEVADQVLRNNYLQTQAISMMEASAVERLTEHRLMINLLERRGILDRRLEFLPDEDALEERQREKQGLTRPELAVLLSYAKLDLYERLWEQHLPMDERQLEELIEYFPTPLRKTYRNAIAEHQLGPQIVTTLLTNSLVNRMGPVFAIRASDDLGYGVQTVAASYVIARHLTATRGLWLDIEAMDTRIPADIQYSMMYQISRKLRHACYWLMKANEGKLDIEACIAHYGDRVITLLKQLPELMTEQGHSRYRRRAGEHIRMGVPEPIAQRVAGLAYITDVLEIVRLADECDGSLNALGELYFTTAERLSFAWIRDAIDSLEANGRWQARARASLRDAAVRAQCDLVSRIEQSSGKYTGTDALDAWCHDAAPVIERTQALMQEMRDNQARDFATLTVAVEELTRLAAT
ncbi:MAG: NAD-glutamate dehydrogenase [Pseudomonadota bacterium]